MVICVSQEDSLMTAEARQRYPSEINRKLSMHVPNLEGVTQAEDSNQTINLEDVVTFDLPFFLDLFEFAGSSFISVFIKGIRLSF